MKRIVVLLLIFALLITNKNVVFAQLIEKNDKDISGYNLNNKILFNKISNELYSNLTETLEGKYFISNVQTAYISKEYIEELEYNSKKNIFFGYTLKELDEQFSGTKYVFDTDENGDTIVHAFEQYDDTYEKVLKNVLVGSGVILICVTVSAISGGIGAPAMSMVFAASAKTGTACALSAGVLSGAAKGFVVGIETNDIEKVLKEAALSGSNAFKWGALAGSISGGTTTAIALKGATLNGLTMNEAALIQKESSYPLDVIKQFKSMDQYKICKEAGLKPCLVNNRMSLIRDIDINFKDEFGRTNAERMKNGLAALDPVTGEAYQLHHVGQKMDSTLAILTESEHMQNGNNVIWHEVGKKSEIARDVFDTQRENFWKTMSEIMVK